MHSLTPIHKQTLVYTSPYKWNYCALKVSGVIADFTHYHPPGTNDSRRLGSVGEDDNQIDGIVRGVVVLLGGGGAPPLVLLL